MKPRIRWVRPWGPGERETPEAHFSTKFKPADADALVCEWAPSEELLQVDGPTAWYNCEPWSHPRMGIHAHRDQRAFLERPKPGQHLHHATPDPRLRVPHVTHLSTAVEPYEGPRERAAAAVVSNAGGRPGRRWPELRLRNAFVTSAGVRLFGQRGKWRGHRATRTSWPRTPSSYSGEVEQAAAAMGIPVPADWTPSPLNDEVKIALLARHHAAICMENTVEPWYFTEKFLDAVLADCVPIYRTHPSVRDGVLRGAVWVDPEDFDFDPGRTLAQALSTDRREVAARNRAWLDSVDVRQTRLDEVWSLNARVVLGLEPTR